MSAPTRAVRHLRVRQAIGPEVTQALVPCLEKGQFILGDKVTAFDAEVAALSGVRHAVGVAHGSDALPRPAGSPASDPATK